MDGRALRHACRKSFCFPHGRNYFDANAGLPELIAQNIDEYVSKAVDLATDKEKLRTIRKGLREKFAASPVMDQERFTRNMETAYREMRGKVVAS